jgi:hypothetical protein
MTTCAHYVYTIQVTVWHLVNNSLSETTPDDHGPDSRLLFERAVHAVAAKEKL